MISNLLVRPSTALPWLLISLGLLTSSTASGTSCPSGYECMTVWGRRYSPWVQLEDFFPRPNWNMNGGGMSEQSGGASEPAEPANPRDKDNDDRIDCLYYLYDHSKGRVEIGDDDGFGIRDIHPVTGARDVPHPGIDYPVETGRKLYAARGGRVVEVETRFGKDIKSIPRKEAERLGQLWKAHPGGNRVLIEHDDGKTSVYLHMKSTNLRVGMNVAVGELVGEANNTGGSTGPHLHYSVRKVTWRSGDSRNLKRYENPETEYDSCSGGGGSSLGIDASDIGNG